jgi:hypothetical protein
MARIDINHTQESIGHSHTPVGQGEQKKEGRTEETSKQRAWNKNLLIALTRN